MQTRPIILIGLALITTASLYLLLNPTSTNKLHTKEFFAHKARFSKKHATQEELKFRLQIFSQNMEMINKHNSSKTSTFTMGVNQFTDLTFEEFKAKYLMTKETANPLSTDNTEIEELNKGKKVDWKEAGMLSPVKNQEACGSCWAFSATGSMEAAYRIHKNQKISVAEQELVDCSGDYGNYGCNGGIMSAAFSYIKDNDIANEDDYVYEALTETCKANKNLERWEIASFEMIGFMKTNVNGLMKMIDRQPVSVAIEVRSDFQHYQEGVYSSVDSCGSRLNHGVLAAGYDTSADVPYFLVKNSWGETWGEEGFIRMAVGNGRGTCGIANSAAVIPTL